VETDKATMEMESFHSGTILKVLADGGSTVKVGDPLVIIGEEGEDISDLLDQLGGGGAPATKASEEKAEAAEAPKEEAEQKSSEAVATTTEDGGRIKVSPLARRIAEDKGLNLANIDGSGPGGRIIKRDVEGAKAEEAPQAAAAAPMGELTGSDVSFVPGEKQRLSQMRKTIAKRLVQVWQTTPHFYLTRQVDMGPLMAHRKQINDQLAAAEAGIKISVNDFIVKAAAAALAEYPAMNVAFVGDGVYEFDEVNVGVAVAIDQGLITPTVRNADQKSVGTISREIRELAGRAREGKLAPEEYSAHTFSVSNLGMYDIDEFMAVINPPDSAILACGTVKDVPVVEDGELTVGTRMKISLACDHRSVDGAVGAEFLQALVRYLETPMMLVI
jgi:pyruvate dehydrogenase E2 component (dihydrolipoamide acetyltransferase)